MALAVGVKAPDFTLRDQHREKRSLAELAGAPAMIVFMPFAFTRTCEGEMCSIRDNLDHLQSNGARVFVITCDTVNSNRVWAEQQGFAFPILSDFWPHGKVATSYGCFNETFGYAERSTFFLDSDGMITDIVASDRLDVPRDFDEYSKALGL
jgi:peroxiredoxin